MPPVWLVRLYQVLFAFLPWSVEYSFGSWAIELPAEPLLAISGIGLLLAWRQAGFPLPKRSALHLAILLWPTWLCATAFSSSMPLVSWKYVLIAIGHLWVFGAGMTLFPGLWRKVWPCFFWSMAGVALYTIIHHGFFYQFRTDQANLAPMPFFADHTVFGASVVMAIWGAIGLGERLDRYKGPAIALLVAALLLTTSRAAVLSLLLTGYLACWFLLYRHWQKKVLLAFTATCLAALVYWQPYWSAKLAGDVSSRERLNRWSCAWRMSFDRPWTGFGPGTFAFQYLPYQKPEEMTRISVVEPIVRRHPGNYGRGGGAHSEYTQALAETGWPGLALWLLVVFVALRQGAQNYFRAATSGQRRLALFLLLGLCSFFLHGLVNNFLHDARVAALVWGMAMAGRFVEPER
ncbi:MAG: O-antigen ligase family protein [Saprospiraceae bacterium]|nr:O-antigen ligase family protein [Saprospiraceae bacterium]